MVLWAGWLASMGPWRPSRARPWGRSPNICARSRAIWNRWRMNTSAWAMRTRGWARGRRCRCRWNRRTRCRWWRVWVIITATGPNYGLGMCWCWWSVPLMKRSGLRPHGYKTSRAAGGAVFGRWWLCISIVVGLFGCYSSVVFFPLTKSMLMKCSIVSVSTNAPYLMVNPFHFGAVLWFAEDAGVSPSDIPLISFLNNLW